MRKSRITESQLLEVLKAEKTGVLVTDLIPKHRISCGTYLRWKSKYPGVSGNELKRMR